jgi:hypothetical protein
MYTSSSITYSDKHGFESKSQVCTGKENQPVFILACMSDKNSSMKTALASLCDPRY